MPMRARGLALRNDDRQVRSRGCAMMTWILLGLVAWGLGTVVVLALFRIAGDQDRAARHEQKRMDPYSDVTITQTGEL